MVVLVVFSVIWVTISLIWLINLSIANHNLKTVVSAEQRNSLDQWSTYHQNFAAVASRLRAVETCVEHLREDVNGLEELHDSDNYNTKRTLIQTLESMLMDARAALPTEEGEDDDVEKS